MTRVLADMLAYGAGLSFALPLIVGLLVRDPARSVVAALIATALIASAYAFLPRTSSPVPDWYLFASILLFGCVVAVFLYLAKRFLRRPPSESEQVASLEKPGRWRSAK